MPIQELLPETLSITNNNSGKGGNVIFGNQYYYGSMDTVNKELLEQNKQLMAKIEELENRLNNL